MRYTIREMVEKDIATVVKHEQEIFQDSLGEDMLYQELSLNPYAHYFVLEVNKKVSGYIGTWIYEDKAEILNFYVLPKYQGYGFGAMLLEFALELFSMSNTHSVSLEVRVSNTRAIQLYEKYGFSKIHTRQAYYKDGEDATVMMKSLEVKK